MTQDPSSSKPLSTAGNEPPALGVVFAAETEGVIENARAKRKTNKCDWILANDVSPATGTFGGDANTVHLVTGEAEETWPTMTKQQVADRLADRIGAYFEGNA